MFNLSGTSIPVCDGNPNHLPQEGKKFIYNEQEYVWNPCDCGCGYPTASKNGDFDFAMTVRLRGPKQGHPIASVLYKLGKAEELIKSNGNAVETMFLLATALEELRTASGGFNDDFDKAVEAKGISLFELLIATGEAMGIPAEASLLEVFTARI